MATFSFVQGAGNSGYTASLAVSLPSAATTGNHIMVAVATDGAAGISVTDNRGNTYNGPVNPFDNSNPEVGIFWATNITGGTLTVTVAFTGSQFVGVAVGEYYCTAAGALTLGVHGLATNATGSTTPASPSVTPTAGSLLIGGMTNTQNGSITPGTGWSDGSTHQLSNANSTQSVGQEYQLSAAGTAVQAKWTIGVSGAWDAAIAEFKAPGGGASVTASDSLTTLADSPTRKVSLQRALSDAAGALSESLARVVRLRRTASDSLTALADALARLTTQARAAADSLGALSDSAVRAAQAFGRSLTDTVTALTDALGRQVSLSRLVSDALTAISDTASAMGGSGRHLIVAVSDSLVTLSDSAARGAQAFTRAASESIAALGDSLSRIQTASRAVGDAVASLSDTAGRIVALGRAAADTEAALSDTAGRGPFAALRSALDTLAAIADTAIGVVLGRVTPATVGASYAVANTVGASWTVV